MLLAAAQGWTWGSRLESKGWETPQKVPREKLLPGWVGGWWHKADGAAAAGREQAGPAELLCSSPGCRGTGGFSSHPSTGISLAAHPQQALPIKIPQISSSSRL